MVSRKLQKYGKSREVEKINKSEKKRSKNLKHTFLDSN